MQQRWKKAQSVLASNYMHICHRINSENNIAQYLNFELEERECVMTLLGLGMTVLWCWE